MNEIRSSGIASPRVEGEEKVSGSAIYAEDIALPEPLDGAVNAWAGRMHWSPDGRQLVYTGWEGGTETLFTRDATAAAPAQTFFASPALFKQAQSWSPDGRFVLYTRHSASNGDDLVTLSATGRRSESPYLSESFDENAGRFASLAVPVRRRTFRRP